jgi:predicted metal-binding membrane protein
MKATSEAVRAPANRRYFLLLMGALITLAWLALWAWGQSPYARFLSHHHLDELRGSGSLIFVFIAGWTVMIVAMMLPTSLPLIALFRRLTCQRPDSSRLVVLLIIGYLGVWALFGVTIYSGDLILHQAVEHSPWLRANVWALGAMTVALAGVYQFTPLKYRCLDKCRSPLSFIMEHWRGHHYEAQAFRLGAYHGLFCLGCCWSLMLLMFAIGVGNLGLMLALAVVMGIEKNMPWGKKISAPLGVILLGWGLALFLGTMPWGP